MVVLFDGERSFGRDAHGAVREEGDTRLASQISRINPGDQWSDRCRNQITLTSSFSYLEPICCSMSSSNYCFLNCIQVSQEAGQVVWYFHLFQNFPQFIVINTVKGFGIVNKAEIDVFLELSCFFDDSADVGNLISDLNLISFLKPA